MKLRFWIRATFLLPPYQQVLSFDKSFSDNRAFSNSFNEWSTTDNYGTNYHYDNLMDQTDDTSFGNPYSPMSATLIPEASWTHPHQNEYTAGVDSIPQSPEIELVPNSFHSFTSQDHLVELSQQDPHSSMRSALNLAGPSGTHPTEFGPGFYSHPHIPETVPNTMYPFPSQDHFEELSQDNLYPQVDAASQHNLYPQDAANSQNTFPYNLGPPTMYHPESSFGARGSTNHREASRSTMHQAEDYHPATTGIFVIDPPNLPLHGAFHYKVVKYEPSTIDGQLVVQLINHLKVGHDIKFFAHPGFSTHAQRKEITALISFAPLMFCLPRDAENLGNFLKFYHEVIETFREPGTTRPAISKYSAREKEPQHVYKKFNPIQDKFNSDSIVRRYLDYVEVPFSEEQKNLDSEIKQKFEDINEIRLMKLNYLKVVNKIFRFYLIYVDMINAIFPRKPLDNEGQFLREERLMAGRSFYQLMKIILLDLEQVSPSESADIVRLAKLILTTKKEISTKSPSFIWTVLQYWKLDSGEVFLSDSKKGLNHQLMSFLHDLLRCFDGLL